jgi:hypothetical protein
MVLPESNRDACHAELLGELPKERLSNPDIDLATLRDIAERILACGVTHLSEMPRFFLRCDARYPAPSRIRGELKGESDANL